MAAGFGGERLIRILVGAKDFFKKAKTVALQMLNYERITGVQIKKDGVVIGSMRRKTWKNCSSSLSMSSPKSSNLRLRSKLEARLKSQLSGARFGIRLTDFTAGLAIKDLRRPVFIASCYDDRSRILCEIWRDAVVVIHNSYLTSFMREVALFAAAFEDGPEKIKWDGPPLELLFTAVGKKFVAEQMHAIAPSHLARVIFLESVIDYERHFRRVYALRDANRRLLTRADLFARLASDFFMHHELGHVAEVDPRFDRFIQPTIDACLAEWAAAGEPTYPDQPLLRREARADIFALNCCFSIYGPDLTEATLRSYCTLLVQAVTALNVMHAAAHDLHRLNADPEHQAIDVNAEFSPMERPPGNYAALSRGFHFR